MCLGHYFAYHCFCASFTKKAPFLQTVPKGHCFGSVFFLSAVYPADTQEMGLLVGRQVVQYGSCSIYIQLNTLSYLFFQVCIHKIT